VASKTGDSDGICNPVLAGTDPDEECGAGVCDGAGICKLLNGEPCRSGIECVSGNCPVEDGVCCDTMCSGTCEACVVSKTGDSDGICSPVLAGTDPDEECNGIEVCNGAGACVSP
jgi:hypothetical protein